MRLQTSTAAASPVCAANCTVRLVPLEIVVRIRRVFLSVAGSFITTAPHLPVPIVVLFKDPFLSL